MLKHHFFIPVLVILACNGSAQGMITSIRGTSSSRFSEEYGGDSSQEMRSPFASLPASINTESSLPRGGLEAYGNSARRTCYSGAFASTSIAYPGEFAVLSMGGSPNGSQQPLYARAESASKITTWWVAESQSYSSVPINLSVSLTGWLYTAGGAATESAIALSVIESSLLDSQLLYASGVAVENQYLATDFTASSGGNWDVWADSWADTSTTITNRAGADTMWDLDYDQEFPAMMVVPSNTPFCIEFTAHSSTFISANSRGKWATSSFGGRANATATTSQFDSVVRELNVVPEPNSLYFFLLSLARIARKSRAISADSKRSLQ